MKGLLLLLIATFNTNRMGSKYLLVQLDVASDEGIDTISTIGIGGTIAATAALGGIAAVPAIAAIGIIPHLGKYSFSK